MVGLHVHEGVRSGARSPKAISSRAGGAAGQAPPCCCCCCPPRRPQVFTWRDAGALRRSFFQDPEQWETGKRARAVEDEGAGVISSFLEVGGCCACVAFVYVLCVV